MAHHTHSVESGLSVEKHIVSILQLSLSNHPYLQKLLDFLYLVLLEINIAQLFLALRPFRVHQELDFSSLAQTQNFIIVELVDLLRESQTFRNRFRDSNLIEGYKGIRGDHTAGTEIYPFPHEMLPEPSLLRSQPLLQAFDFLGNAFFVVVCFLEDWEMFLIYFDHN